MFLSKNISPNIMTKSTHWMHLPQIKAQKRGRPGLSDLTTAQNAWVGTITRRGKEKKCQRPGYVKFRDERCSLKQNLKQYTKNNTPFFSGTDFLPLVSFSKILPTIYAHEHVTSMYRSFDPGIQRLTVHAEAVPKTTSAAQLSWHHGAHTHLQTMPVVKPRRMRPGVLTGSTSLGHHEMESTWRETEGRPGECGHTQLTWTRQSQRRWASPRRAQQEGEMEKQPTIWLYLTNSHAWLLPSSFFLRQDQSWEFSPEGQEYAAECLESISVLPVPQPHTGRPLPGETTVPAATATGGDSGTMNPSRHRHKWVFPAHSSELAPAPGKYPPFHCSSGDLGWTHTPLQVTDPSWPHPTQSRAPSPLPRSGTAVSLRNGGPRALLKGQKETGRESRGIREDSIKSRTRGRTLFATCIWGARQSQAEG